VTLPPARAAVRSRFSFFAQLALLGGLAVGCTSEEALPPPPPEPVPVVEESEPLQLEILKPERAAFLSESDGADIEVFGLGASPGLTINGDPVTPEADGSFKTIITAHSGLNVLHAEDELSSVDTPFLFGTYAAPSKALPGAVSVRINAGGFKNTDLKVASLTRLAQLGLDDIDLLAQLKGQIFSGTFTGGSWSFKVSSTSYTGAKVSFLPRTGGASFQATVSKVAVKGVLTVKVLFTKTDNATLSIDSTSVNGNIDAALSKGSLTAKGSSVTTKITGFSYDSNNAGFPCCVDWILTQVMQGNIESAVKDNVKAALESKVAFALNQLGLPPSVDLSSTGFPAKIGIKQTFDGASFTASGATLSAQLHFTGAYAADDPGKLAPGWFELGSKPLTLASTTPYGVSISLDALNQALFTVWGQNALARTVDDVPTVGSVTLTPKLPPIVTLSPEGKLTAALGEVIVEAKLGGNPFKAAVSVIDEVTPTLSGAAGKLTLAPSKSPQISLSWLDAEKIAPALRNVVKAMILEQVPSMLTPIALPLPSLPLAAFAPSQAANVAALGPTSTLKLDPKTNRAAIQGALVIMPAPK